MPVGAQRRQRLQPLRRHPPADVALALLLLGREPDLAAGSPGRPPPRTATAGGAPPTARSPRRGSPARSPPGAPARRRMAHAAAPVHARGSAPRARAEGLLRRHALELQGDAAVQLTADSSSSSSTTAAICSYGTAPDTNRPLMNMAGVPETPAAEPLLHVLLHRLGVLARERHSGNVVDLQPDRPPPSPPAPRRRGLCWSANIASCICQNRSWSWAHSDASAAFWALAWIASGNCLKTSRTWSPYSSFTRSRVGTTREQKGHSKSENSTIVTGAFAGPVDGSPLMSTSAR